MGQLKHYIKPHVWYIIFTLAIKFVGTYAELWIPTLMETMLDEKVPNGDLQQIYIYGGLMLLDLNDPSKIIAMAEKPLLMPDQDYELDGFRGSVIFPGGMILEDSGEVKIYYGAADTVECLATCDVNDLLKFAKNEI